MQIFAILMPTQLQFRFLSNFKLRFPPMHWVVQVILPESLRSEFFLLF